MNGIKQYRLANLLLIVVLIMGLIWGGFGSRNLAIAGTTLGCSNLDIVGEYQCNVACVARDSHDEDHDGHTDDLRGFTVSGEIDTIEAFELEQVEETDKFYRVSIKSGDFTEFEMGPLVGCTLRTATESVSDDTFPVLEEYIFEDGYGIANEFTKVVRNPSKENFKTCKVNCTKNNLVY